MKEANHAKAPATAAFVNAMREVFGEAKVIYVSENGVRYGKPVEPGASCMFAGNGIPWREWRAKHG